jgi:LacI family gluconate utilization system Gnt-I transcriptional repressor
MDACRLEIGRKAAEIIAAQLDNPDAEIEKHVTLTPTITFGDTLKRR